MEMLGALGGIAGGAFSIAGAQEGAEASRDASEANTLVNMINFMLRERERKDRIRQAEQNRSDQHLGATDAEGNRTHFVEGVGWVSELSTSARNMKALQDREQSAVLAHDLPMKRAQMDRNIARQRDEDYIAKGLLDQFRNVQQEDPDAWKNRLYGAANQGISEAFAEQGDQAMRKAIRTGASNTGDILAALGGAQAAALEKARVNAELQAPQIARQDYDQKRASAANFYNMFAERAGRMPEISYQPQNVTPAVNSLISQFAQEAGVSGRDLAAAFGAKGGVFDYFQPDYGEANALASTGQVIGSVGNRLGSALGGMMGGTGGGSRTNSYVDDRLRSGG